MSTLVIGVTGDDASVSLESTARNALQSIGVNNMNAFGWRWKVAFVAQIGRPAATVANVLSAYGDNARISVLVQGRKYIILLSLKLFSSRLRTVT